MPRDALAPIIDALATETVAFRRHFLVPPMDRESLEPRRERRTPRRRGG
jgi:hypothetical protein